MTDKPTRILPELTNAEVYKAVMERNPIGPIGPMRPLETLTDEQLIKMHDAVREVSRTFPVLSWIDDLMGLVIAERGIRNHDF
jgi:hypothetical protein